jgi:hypothetical protein
MQFQDALVTSTVVFYSTGKTEGTVLFTAGDDIHKPDIKKNILTKDLNLNDKWSWYFSAKPRQNKNMTTIGNYFFVKRGIATGSNKHFILTDEAVKRLDISCEYLKPILPSPRYIRSSIIEIGPDGRIEGIKKLYLLNITCSETEMINLPQSLIRYLDEIYPAIKDNYIIRNRSPWFKQEYRPECPFLISYMGRNPKEPFRLFLNKTNATVPNVYLMLYPKFNWKEAEAQNSGFLKKMHAKLQNINPETFVLSGRVYGGGLYKLEPKELMNVPIDNILSTDLIDIIEKTKNIVNQPLLF